MRMAAYEVSNLTVADPRLLSDLEYTWFCSTDWDVLNPSPERLQIDGAVFEALGLTTGERDAVYEGVAELVSNRSQRARTHV